MSSVVIKGDTSGQITLAAPAVAGTNTLSLPASTGTVVVESAAVSAVGQIPFSTDGSTYTPTAKIVSGTSQASTTGTAIDFTGIPSWAKRITVMFNGVSLSGTDDFLVQLGTSGGFVTSGYASTSGYSTTYATSTSGMVIAGLSVATALFQGAMTINLFSGTSWVNNHSGAQTGTARYVAGGGSVDAGGVVTQIRITRSGTNTFDAGSINILYE